MSAKGRKIIHYDEEADVLLVQVREGKVRREILLDEDIVIGVDERGNVLYVEVWDASERGLGELLHITRRAARPATR